jgi:uncharacterized protein YeaO (DUF488 family)
MKYLTKDLWVEIEENKYDMVCITTNGFVKKNGNAVMGAGIARQFRDKYGRAEFILGEKITNCGNIVQHLMDNFFAFPVKHKWDEDADLALIEKSCLELVKLADMRKAEKILLPFPGVGNGKRSKEEVTPIIERYLDDRFIVIDDGADRGTGNILAGELRFYSKYKKAGENLMVITRWKPDWVDEKDHFPDFAPTPQLSKALKDGKVTWDEFKEAYMEMLDSHVINEVYEKAMNLMRGDNNTIILSWEKGESYRTVLCDLIDREYNTKIKNLIK